MIKPKFDAVGVGCCAVDYLGIVPRYPEPDVKMQMLELIQQGGGLAATAMVTVARLGGSAAYIGKVGDDALGQFIIRELEREGVNAGFTVVEKGGSARFAFIIVDKEKGTRTILWSQKNAPSLKVEELSKDAVLSARVLLVDEHEPEASIAAARLAREADIPVVLDAEMVNPVTKELLNLATIIIVPKHFAQELTGKRNIRSAGEAMHALYTKTVVLTAGAEGSLYTGGGESFSQPAFPVEVVDTTGAGDVFHGAFVFGLLQSWPSKEVTEFASAVAALKCRKLGGRAGIPSLKETYAFLADRSGGAWINRNAG